MSPVWTQGFLVGVRGFEPPTPASRRRCSTRLSYTPKGSVLAIAGNALAERSLSTPRCRPGRIICQNCCHFPRGLPEKPANVGPAGSAAFGIASVIQAESTCAGAGQYQQTCRDTHVFEKILCFMRALQAFFHGPEVVHHQTDDDGQSCQ